MIQRLAHRIQEDNIETFKNLPGQWFPDLAGWGSHIWGAGITILVIFVIMIVTCIFWKKYKTSILTLLVPKPTAQALPIQHCSLPVTLESEIRFPSFDFFLLSTLLLIAILLTILIIIKLSKFEARRGGDGLYLQVVTRAGENMHASPPQHRISGARTVTLHLCGDVTFRPGSHTTIYTWMSGLGASVFGRTSY